MRRKGKQMQMLFAYNLCMKMGRSNGKWEGNTQKLKLLVFSSE